MISHSNPHVAAYLRRLERASAALPRSRRSELVAEIREHIDDALLDAGAADDVAVRDMLERLGPPEEIVAAAGPTQRESGRLELAAMIALVIPLLGWILGVVLVAASRAWTRREKTIAIAIALVPAVLLGLTFTASGGSESSVPVEAVAEAPLQEEPGGDGGGLGPIELVIVLGTFLAGPLSAVYLGSRLRRPSDSAGLVSA